MGEITRDLWDFLAPFGGFIVVQWALYRHLLKKHEMLARTTEKQMLDLLVTVKVIEARLEERGHKETIAVPSVQKRSYVRKTPKKLAQDK